MRLSNSFVFGIVICLFCYIPISFASMRRSPDARFYRWWGNVGRCAGLLYLGCVGVIVPTTLVCGVYGLAGLAWDVARRRHGAALPQDHFDEKL